MKFYRRNVLIVSNTGFRVNSDALWCESKEKFIEDNFKRDSALIVEWQEMEVDDLDTLGFL